MSTSLVLDRDTKEALSWNSAQRTFYARLAHLVQYFQMEYGGGCSADTMKALILPKEFMSYAEKSDNPDLVPTETIQQALNPLTIIEGVPTIDAIPIWDRLSGEPLTCYNLFRLYRDMIDIEGTRSMTRVAEANDISTRDISFIAKAYHWQCRVIPYDRNKEAEFQARRAIAARRLDSNLGKKAVDLIESASTYLEDKIDQLSPKYAIELLKVMIPVSRIAVGLPGNAPVEERRAGGSTSSSGRVEVNINNANGNNAAAGGVHGLTESEVIEKMRNQNEDPSQLASIANVLIKSGAIESTILNEPESIDVDFEVDEEDVNDAVE